MHLYVLDNNLTFVILGDWGHDGPLQEEVADSMETWAQLHGCDFILSTGDNFYPDGLDSPSGPQVDRWRTVYSQPAIKHLKWYITLGNHDKHVGRGRNSQLLLHNLEPRWQIPSHFFYFNKTLGETSILFVSIDTVMFLMNRQSAHKQVLLLIKQLVDQKYRWCTIFTHYPMFSASEMYKGDHRLYSLLFPIFKRYQVDFYISGHDHDLEHFTQKQINTDFIISGTGSKPPYPFDPNSQVSLQKYGVTMHSFLRENGFVSITLTTRKAMVHFVSKNGTLMYSFKRNKLK